MKKPLAATVLGGLSLSALLALTAVAATPPEFASADVNGDQAVSFEELTAVMPDATAEAFVAADANGDGVLTADEYATLGS